jgi:hypothetical protein
MNYIIENNIDFFSEINNENNNNNDSNEDMCLISGEKLNENFITLNCKHKFNYYPLYKEVISQKKKNHYSTTNIGPAQLQCPYCRNIQQGILPYIPYALVDDTEIIIQKLKCINCPDNWCMKHCSCTYKLSSGKNKGNICNKVGFESNVGKLCISHWKIMKVSKINSDFIENNIENIQIYKKKYTVVDLKKLLKEKNLSSSGSKMDLIVRLLKNTKM